jgi:NAD(P)-dependent dehydrogenase (short-subunit alcohol dehydrogenase family)
VTQASPSRTIINGSIGAIRPRVGTGFYSATKAAVYVLSGIYAVELAEYGITVNSVGPGTTETKMSQDAAKYVNGTVLPVDGGREAAFVRL